MLPVADIIAQSRFFSAAALATKYGTSDGSIRRILRRAKVKLAPGRRRDLSLVERNRQIRACRAEGTSLEAIGRRFGLTKERIRQIVDH